MKILTYELLNALREASLWLLVIPLILGIVRWKRVSNEIRLIILIVWSTFIVYFATRYLHNLSANNSWIYNVYTPSVFVLMVLLYTRLLSVKKAKFLGLILISLFLVFCIYTTFYVHGNENLNTNAITLSCLVYTLFAVVYFGKLISQPRQDGYKKNPFVYFNFGVLLYYSSAFFLFFVVGNDLSLHPNLFRVGWTINNFLNLFLIVSYILVLWIKSPA